MKAIMNVVIFMCMIVLINAHGIAGKFTSQKSASDFPEMINDFLLNKGAYWLYNVWF
jgi:hypothetical protein